MGAHRSLVRNAAIAMACVVFAAVADTTAAASVSDAATVADVSSATSGISTTVHNTSSIKEVGALFRNGKHFCTASVVQSQGRNLLVTAAHCMSGGTSGLTFAPGYHDGKTPYGVWTVSQIFTDSTWQASGSVDHDFAFLEVAALNGRQIQDAVGGSVLDTSGRQSGTVTLIGYPDSGTAPLVCSNTITAYSSTQDRIYCTNYTDGTSGGPWITKDGHLIGVIGGYQQGGDTPDVSYSVRFGSAVAALYNSVVQQIG